MTEEIDCNCNWKSFSSIQTSDTFLLQILYHDKKIEMAIESFFSSIQTSDTCSSVMEYNYGFHLTLDDLKVFNPNFLKVQILQEPR